jgi:hypothetical protein
MPRLFSYTVATDDGAAPNPFHGMCSLAICKPRIRSAAEIGDWVAGLGSKNTNGRDLSGHLVYAMRVDDILTLEQYDQRAAANWADRIPDIKSKDLTKRLGDCIYDYSSSMPKQRPSVHGPGNIKRDLGGRNVLLSWDFYYFGRNAISLEPELMSICHQTQAHKSDANAPYFDKFVKWIRGYGCPGTGQVGWPDHTIDWTKQDQECGFGADDPEEVEKEVC